MEVKTSENANSVEESEEAYHIDANADSAEAGLTAHESSASSERNEDAPVNTQNKDDGETPNAFKGNHIETDIPDENAAQFYFDERTKAVDDLCRDLCSSYEHFSKEKWLTNLENYIKNGERLLYSEISNYYFDSARESDLSKMESNIDGVRDYVFGHAFNRDNYIESENLKKVALKFWDHINLAKRQMIFLNGTKETVKDIIQKELQPTTQSITSQLVALVSIFTALSFVLFGGISALGALFTNFKDISSMGAAFFLCIVWGFCMINMLFAFMHFVFRIVRGGGEENPDAPVSMGEILKMHPYVVAINFILITVIAFTGWFLFAYHNGIGKNAFSSFVEFSRGFGVFFIITALMAFIACLIAHKLYCSVVGKKTK